jgi:hypothetical protein
LTFKTTSRASNGVKPVWLIVTVYVPGGSSGTRNEPLSFVVTRCAHTGCGVRDLDGCARDRGIPSSRHRSASGSPTVDCAKMQLLAQKNSVRKISAHPIDLAFDIFKSPLISAKIMA